MENPEISVIIPVYNTEEYVRDAIMSILNQTLKEIEIIVVNDGSTDNGLQIIKELAESDTRIQVYSQENQGQAIARNYGLEKAKGKYLYFMDSDDLLEKEALTCCYEKCEKENLDFVFFDAEVFGDTKWTSSFFDYDRSKIVKNSVYTGKEILDLLLQFDAFRAPSWLYLVKHDFVRHAGIRFCPVRHEDLLFSSFVHIYSQRVGYLSRKFFRRRLRPNSVMTTRYSSEDINAYLTIIGELSNAKTENTRQIIDNLIGYIINPAIHNARTLPFSERMRVLNICVTKSYLKFITLKNKTVFLFPFTVKLKSFFKKKNDRYN